MRMTAAVVAVLCAAAAKPVAARDTVAVRIRVAFDRAIRTPIRVKAQDEAHAIWLDSGVDIQWTDGAVELYDGLDVIVEQVRSDPDATELVLGRVKLQRGEEGSSGPIRIAYDAIAAILDGLYGRRYDNDFLRNAHIGTALGRVLAHEIGHVLLGPPGYHDARGLMRPRFEASELAGPQRTPFLLADQSVVRLRGRLTSTLFRPQHDALTPARE